MARLHGGAPGKDDGKVDRTSEGTHNRMCQEVEPPNDIKLSGEEEGAQRLTTSPLQRRVRRH